MRVENRHSPDSAFVTGVMDEASGFFPLWLPSGDKHRLTLRLPRRFRSSRFLFTWLLICATILLTLSLTSHGRPQIVRQMSESAYGQTQLSENRLDADIHPKRWQHQLNAVQGTEEEPSVDSMQRVDVPNADEDPPTDAVREVDQHNVNQDVLEEKVVMVDQVDEAYEPPSELTRIDSQVDFSTDSDDSFTGVEEILAEVKGNTAPSHESEEHLDLEQQAELFPDVIHIPFEDAVKDEQLAGWEEEWISDAKFNAKFAPLSEPKIDFVYLWVNGSDEEFQQTKRPWELNSVLNDDKGIWINSHGTNRYRDWDELRYSFRSVQRNAGHFRNNIQVLVNSANNGKEKKRQTPSWLVSDTEKHGVQVIAQEDFFDDEMTACLPTFNSLTIENQMFNVPSDVDQFFALSDDMLLGAMHSASDIYSPLFGPVLGFKTNAYSTVSPPTEQDARRFGEKPYLIYTSWLLNRRFGARKRKGQSHFGHSLSRSVMKEALTSFRRPYWRSACKRFRGEPGFQLYSWYATFHYLIERHREALLWSYIMLRSDTNGDGILSWEERKNIVADIANGYPNLEKTSFRRRNFYHVPAALEKAGLKAPLTNTDIQWTSLDGPVAIRDADCSDFSVDDCLAPGFNSSYSFNSSPVFSSAVIFDRVSRQTPHCGDCLLKIVLNQVHEGLSPLLPLPGSQAKQRELVIKALMRYKYTIIDPADALFVMVTDADQIDSTLIRRYVREGKNLPRQLCLNDDVSTTDPEELQDVQQAMHELLQGIFPDKCSFEK